MKNLILTGIGIVTSFYISAQEMKEKQSSVTNPTVKKNDEMKMPKDSSKQQSMNMDNMQMSHTEKPKTEIKKTIVNNTPPQTVRYDLYIADTTVTFGKKAKRAIA